jgi:hypothetical protein
MVMRISATIHGTSEKFLIVCPTGEETIQWLCEAAYNRYREIYTDRVIPYLYRARRATDRSLLSLTDRVELVLKDNDSVHIGRIDSLTPRSCSTRILDVAKRFDDADSSTPTT